MASRGQFSSSSSSEAKTHTDVEQQHEATQQHQRLGTEE